MVVVVSVGVVVVGVVVVAVVVVVVVVVVMVAVVVVGVVHVVCFLVSVSIARLLLQSQPPRAGQDSISVRCRAMPVPQPALTVVHCSGYA